ncbi:hypothetical protein RBSH_01330 [Rhodopirellula baltica SH28]|uniref:Uncharacterized protein n=1 Tax=Rhodopirellula baltica SH28 TaxID=993517 RepID=K5DKF1_RHOBT|nr:hypothetical protein RBSH_01330 [Rhodopirellula baltica SH28]
MRLSPGSFVYEAAILEVNNSGNNLPAFCPARLTAPIRTSRTF